MLDGGGQLVPDRLDDEGASGCAERGLVEVAVEVV